MKALKIKKAPILLPLAILAAALAAYTFLHMQGISAAGSLSLGRQYLTELNYGGAIAAFTQAIELDPNSKEARIGLARAYRGTENYDMAEKVLEELTCAGQPDEEAAAEMVDILRSGGKLGQAVQMAQLLIAATDKEEYYRLLDGLLEELYAQPRSYAAGTDHALKLIGGEVLSRGENALGQLGTEPDANPEQAGFAPAGFPGTAVKAACAGRTSLVIDSSGGLWAAGENRWGQMGGGYAVTSPQGGWTQVPCPGPAADAAGTTGRLLVLLEDGSLWSAGADGSQTLRRLSRFPAAAAIAASESQAAVLTTDGQLYRSWAQTPETWELAASGVYTFGLSDDTLCWAKQGGGLGSDRGWTGFQPGENGGAALDAPVSIVSAGGRTYCTVSGGGLYCLRDGQAGKEVPCGGPVRGLYAQGDLIILEYGDGTAAYIAGGADTPAPLEAL